MWKMIDCRWWINFLKNIWYTSSLNWCWIQNWAMWRICWLGHNWQSPQNQVSGLRWSIVWKCFVLDPIELCIMKSWLKTSSTTFFRNINIAKFSIFQRSSRPPPSIMLQHIHWATFVNSAFFSKIFKFQTDLVMAIGQTFSCWCIKQRRQFTSKQNSSLPKKCRKIRFWDWYWKCCQRAQKDSKVVQKRFWDVVLTWKRHSFTFQTHNFHLLATILSLIFEASKCSIFRVGKELLSDVSKIKKKWSFFGLYQ